MKKRLFALPVVLLLAAGCSTNQPAVENQPNNKQQTQNQQTTPPSPTETVSLNPATVKIVDKGNLYSVEIPKDWKVTESTGPRGVSVSSLHLESPDWKSSSVAGGPHDNIYYKTGAYLSISVDTLNEDPSANSSIVSKKSITIDGARGTYYTFTEPSLSEGQLLGAYTYYKGKSYTFRFGFNPKTFTQGETTFADILSSFKFTN